MTPTATTPRNTRAVAVSGASPAFIIASCQAVAMAITATIDRSMPRPITTTPMPTARMPSTDTERRMATRLFGARKPLRNTA